ncbi:fructuronate reductase [Zobellella aerophila]|uniref:Fructuronate reductase n=1 Tax=Zobellella aerophila TaxID=870480 RepID=A0ABP6W1X4_9GAMM
MQLNRNNLKRANAGTAVPGYDRAPLQSRILHFGFGAFHRAHQALYQDRLLQLEGGGWGICVVNLRSAGLLESLRAQDHLFTVLEQGAEGNQARVIGSVTESLHPRLDSPAAVIAKLADPQLAIVSITLTEKGYCINPATGRLDWDNPDILRDLAEPGQPVSLIGYIVAGLAKRQALGLAGVSVMSCDNIPDNGRVIRQAVLDLASRRDPMLAAWIEREVSFPSTMVDRIVPAVTADTRRELRDTLGLDDACGVATEPFTQWVIEDDFVAGRPAWEKVGVELVRDVRPFEAMKLRMLNGTHSFLAYLGYLAGYEYVSDCMADPVFAQAARRLMLDEQGVTLSMPEQEALTAYGERLLARFRNPCLRHRTWQIAMDGTMKLPQRLLAPIRQQLAEGRPWPLSALAVAGWMHYVGGVDEQGNAIDVRDPLCDSLASLVQAAGDDEALVRRLIGLESVFGSDLSGNEGFVGGILPAYRRLKQRGAALAVADTLSLRQGDNDVRR